MVRKLLGLATVLLVAACAQVTNERRSTIDVDGRTFPLVTQTVQSGNRTYDVSYVIVKNERRQCRPESPGDCEATAKETRRSGNNR